MLQFIKNGPADNSGAIPYDVLFDRHDTTVKTFIEAVLSEKKSDSGYLYVTDNDIFRGKSSCQYRKGKLLSEIAPEFLERPVKLVKAKGALRRMDYSIRI